MKNEYRRFKKWHTAGHGCRLNRSATSVLPDNGTLQVKFQQVQLLCLGQWDGCYDSATSTPTPFAPFATSTSVTTTTTTSFLSPFKRYWSRTGGWANQVTILVPLNIPSMLKMLAKSRPQPAAYR